MRSPPGKTIILLAIIFELLLPVAASRPKNGSSTTDGPMKTRETLIAQIGTNLGQRIRENSWNSCLPESVSIRAHPWFLPIQLPDLG